MHQNFRTPRTGTPNGSIVLPYASGFTRGEIPDFAPDPTASWPGDVDSEGSSGDDVLHLPGPSSPRPRPYPRPHPHPSKISSGGGSSWPRVTQLGSFDSHQRPRRCRSIRYLSPSRGSKTESRSELESVDTDVTASTTAERHRLWTRVSVQRNRIRQMRAYLSDRRREKRSVRLQKSQIDNDFMQIFRPQLTSNRSMAVVSMETIKQKFGEMQRIRDEYYALESTYEVIEENLTHEEFKLQELENELHNFLDIESRTDHDESSTDRDSSLGQSVDSEDASDSTNESGSGPGFASSDSALPYDLLGISGMLQEDIHPLYRQLLDAAGDRDLTIEHHDDLVLHRKQIMSSLELELHRERQRNNPGSFSSEEELNDFRSSLSNVPADPDQFRARFGIEIDSDDLEFLRNYEHEEETVRRSSEAMSVRVERLMAWCVEHDVMRRHAPYAELFAILSGSDRVSLLAEGNMVLEPPPPTAAADLAHFRFPILLSNPAHVLRLQSPLAALERAMEGSRDNPAVAQRRAECMKEYGIANLMKKAVNVADYINQWLIHRLRTSPMEVELMFSIFEESFKVVNLRRWQEDVLFHWRKDDTASMMALGPEDGIASDDSARRVNSINITSERARSDEGGVWRSSHHHADYEGSAASARSFP